MRRFLAGVFRALDGKARKQRRKDIDYVALARSLRSPPTVPRQFPARPPAPLPEAGLTPLQRRQIAIMFKGEFLGLRDEIHGLRMQVDALSRDWRWIGVDRRD